MKNRITIILLSMICTVLSAQESELFFDRAEALPSEVNSDGEEAGVLLTPDGKQLYFVRTFFEDNVGGEEAGHDIWRSTKTETGWSEATNSLGPLNTTNDDAVVGISQDGKRIYLLNTYQKEKKRVTGIAVATVKEKGYSKPKYHEIPNVEYDGSFFGFYMNPSEDVLIISTEGYEAEGEEDLYVSFNKGGEWTVPVWMGPNINSEGYEIAPFLSPDGKRLYFSSNGFGGWGGADIYESSRLDNSWTNWSKPRNLGRNINGRGFDAYISVTTEGVVYFTSNRSGSANIYKSRILKDNEYYIDESGIVHYTAKDLQAQQDAEKTAQELIDAKFKKQLAEERKKEEAAKKEQEAAQLKAQEEAAARASAAKQDQSKDSKAADKNAQQQAAKELENKQKADAITAQKAKEQKAKANTTLEGAPASSTTSTAVPSKKKTKGQVLSFNPNQAFLTPEGGIQMDNAAFFLMDTEELKIKLYVETDSKNEKLNMERAEEASYYLQGKGIAKDRIVIDGPHRAPATSIEIFFEF